MSKRKERALEELYGLTDRITGPEITPVLKGSFRIQGPVDEMDRDNWRFKETSPVKTKIRKGTMDDDLRSGAESGTCNVCAAPCSSCMHFSRTVSVMESKIEEELSGEICKTKEANYCSSSNTDVLPLFKSRACDERQCTASETSNLLSAGSCHDSFSENAESKATMKTSDTDGVCEDVEMLPKLSSGRIIKDDELHARQCNVDNQGVAVSSGNGIPLDVGQKYSRQYEDQQGLECHDDNMSCITAIKDANVPVSDHNCDSDKKRVSYSYASTDSFLAAGLVKAEQHQTSPDSVTDCECVIEESLRNSNRASTCTKHSLQKSISGIASGAAGLSCNSDPSEPPSSNDVCVRNNTLKSRPPHSHSQSVNSFFGLGDSKESGENSSFQLEEGPFPECSMDHGDSSLAGSAKTDSVDGHKFGALDSGSGSSVPNTGDSKSSLVRKNSSSAAFMKVYPCLETDIDVDGDKPPETSVKFSDRNQQFQEPITSLGASKTQNHPLKSQLISEIEHSTSDIMEVDVKVCDICGDTGREEMLATCSRCSDGAEHIYCMQIMLDKIPESDWLCEECQLKEDAERQKLEKTKEIPETPKATYLEEKELLSKLKNKAQEAGANQAIKAIITPKVSTKRHVDSLEVALNSNKDAVETKVGSPGTASSSKRAALSRESSFKKLNAGKVKPVYPVPSSGNHSANSSQQKAQSPAASPHAPWMQARTQAGQGSLSRSVSFSNPKPKLKQIREDVFQKQKLSREFTNGGTRKEGTLKTFGQSQSFKSTISGLSTIVDSKAKLISPITSRSDQSRGLKQGKDQIVIERKKSFRSDGPVFNPSLTAGTTTDLRKGVEHDGKLSTSKSTILVASKKSENLIAFDGSAGIKQQCNSEEKQPFQVGPKKSVAASSCAHIESHASPDILRQDGLPPIRESMNQDGKTKDPYKQNVSSGGKDMQCHRFKEMGHVSQFCKASSALKASAASSMKEVTNKRSKWKDVVAAAMLSSKHKSNKLPGQFDELPIPSSSRSLATPAGRSTLECQPTHSVLNAIPSVPDDTKIKLDMSRIPIQSSLQENLPRVSAIPDLEYIWQGGFEVQRSGSSPDFYDGIQAHLSTCASPKVLEVVNKFSCKVQLEEVSRMNAWPMQFQGNRVAEDNIALYFFAKDVESYERNYKRLLENMLKKDLALKGNFGEIELLIFPSNCLPEKSQRWNRLFFMWAVFKGRRKNCSPSSSDYQKKLCGFTVDVEPFVQDRPTPVKAEVAVSQKITMQENMDGELSTCYGLHKELDTDSSCYVDFSSLSSSAKEDGTFSAKVSSLDRRPEISSEFTKPSSDGIRLSEKGPSNLFPDIYTSASVRQKTGLPGTCSLSTTMMNDAQLCSEMNSSSASQKEVYIDPTSKKVTELQPYTQATNVQSGLDKVKAVPMHSNTSSCRQAGLSSISPDRQDASSDPSKIFSVRKESVTGNRGQEEIGLVRQRLTDTESSLERDTQVQPITKELSGWEVRSSRKRPCVISYDTASEASVETSMKMTHTVAWRENTDCILFGSETEYKKMKLNSDVVSEEQILGDRFSSKMCCPYPSFQSKEQKDAHVCEDRLKTTERHLFPMDLGPVGDLKAGSIVPWQILPSNDEKLQESDSPNLELALGAKNKPFKEVLPLFAEVEDDRSDRNKLLDKVKGAGDDASASPPTLGLSLSVKEHTAKSVTVTEPLLPEKSHRNRSLLLFGRLIDT
ncbi:hypothetical protein CKAN_01634300 [Cinnamomum micranthum f. kanehirae]|uniref:PHD-type domain-containing protein n=1 Tax=Cinnamomum micranthum f. kanehirae TaxID=337451 RepID=A0A3S3MW78_9MAGN|nr:hypothetical protein CKAN_01634300 [Cinnamomum micranthum f. kanehirae]